MMKSPISTKSKKSSLKKNFPKRIPNKKTSENGS
jgi:hypothetical protein